MASARFVEARDSARTRAFFIGAAMRPAVIHRRTQVHRKRPPGVRLRVTVARSEPSFPALGAAKD